MDFIDNLKEALTDYFSTPNGYITLILIAVTAIVTTIIHYALPAVGRFIKNLWRVFPMLKWRWQKWLIDRLKEGKSIGWQKKTGFRYHAGKYEWYHVSVDEMRPVIETVRKLGKL